MCHWLHRTFRPPNCPSVTDASPIRQSGGASSSERHVDACGPSNRAKAWVGSAGLAKDSFFTYTAISSSARDDDARTARTDVAVRASGWKGFQRSRFGLRAAGFRAQSGGLTSTWNDIDARMSSSKMRWDRANARSSSDWRRYSSGSAASSATALGCFSAPPGSRSGFFFTAARAVSVIDAKSNTAVTACAWYPEPLQASPVKAPARHVRGHSAKHQRAVRSGAFFRLERASSSVVDSWRHCCDRV